MSLYCQGTGDYASYAGQISTISEVPLTISCWVYRLDLNANADTIVQYGNGGGSVDYAVSVRTTTTAQCEARHRDTTTSSSTTTETAMESAWHHYAGVFASTTSRTGYLDGAAAAENTGNRSLATAFDELLIGDDFASVTDFNGYVCHVAIWKSALNGTQITALANGAHPTTIDSSNLVAYWPMSNAANVGEEYFGNYGLTINGDAVYNAEQKSIDALGTKYLKLLVHPSAIGQVITEGIVLAESTSSPLTVVGDKIGEFVGGSPQYVFQDGSAMSPATDAGYAVLLIPVDDFGGSALTTDNTPFAVARNASYTTGLVACTVIQA